MTQQQTKPHQPTQPQSLYYSLPDCLLRIIYSYDDTYKKAFDVVLAELKQTHWRTLFDDWVGRYPEKIRYFIEMGLEEHYQFSPVSIENKIKQTNKIITEEKRRHSLLQSHYDTFAQFLSDYKKYEFVDVIYQNQTFDLCHIMISQPNYKNTYYNAGEVEGGGVGHGGYEDEDEDEDMFNHDMDNDDGYGIVYNNYVILPYKKSPNENELIKNKRFNNDCRVMNDIKKYKEEEDMWNLTEMNYFAINEKSICIYIGADLLQ